MGTDKTPSFEQFAELKPVFEARLDKFDREVNNNKFWHIGVYELEGKWFVVRRWGRNGTKGQNKVEPHYAKWQALDEAEKLANKKRDEGYKNDPSLLEKLAREVQDD